MNSIELPFFDVGATDTTKIENRPDGPDGPDGDWRHSTVDALALVGIAD